MFDKARGLVWMDALETIVEIMFACIIKWRARYADMQADEILLPARRRLQRNYDASKEACMNFFVGIYCYVYNDIRRTHTYGGYIVSLMRLCFIVTPHLGEAGSY